MQKLFLFLLPILLTSCAHKRRSLFHPLVVVVPSYNNAQYYRKNLNSIIHQKYPNFRIIYIDDNSTDSTGPSVQHYIKAHRLKNITFIQNTTRIGALANHHNALSHCVDNEIIVSVDGDDWLAHAHVLSRINREYCSKNIWVTYGQFENWPTRKPGWCKDIPAHIIANNAFRKFGFCSAQPRTYFAWLARKIKPSDLKDSSNNFYSVAGDTALMFPLLEMAGNRFSFITDILYNRNVQTPINDFKVNQKLQEQTTLEIRSKRRYARLTAAPAGADEIKYKNGGLVAPKPQHQG